MKKVLLILATLITTIPAMADLISEYQFNCDYQLADSKILKAKVICDLPVEAKIKAFYSEGWVSQSDLSDAKLCIYDKQLFGNTSKPGLKDGGKAVTVRLLTKYNNYYDESTIVEADSDYLERNSKLKLIGKLYQGLKTTDYLTVSYNPYEEIASYKFLYGKGLLTRAKAYVKVDFANCKKQ